jgi:hypothetical protein
MNEGIEEVGRERRKRRCVQGQEEDPQVKKR